MNMSTYHYIYAEANVKGKWYSLNPVMPLSGGGYGTGAITYFSRSSYPEMIYHLKVHSIYSGLPEDISNTTKQHFRDNLDDSADYWASEMTYRDYYKMTVFVVNFDTAIGFFLTMFLSCLRASWRDQPSSEDEHHPFCT